MGDGIHVRFVGRALRSVSPRISPRVEVDLSAANGVLAVEWLNPRTGEIVRVRNAQGGGRQRFPSPFGGDAILYLSRGSADSRQR